MADLMVRQAARGNMAVKTTKVLLGKEFGKGFQLLKLYGCSVSGGLDKEQVR